MNREFQRLRAVNRFKKLDPGIANDLNDIVNLAAQICNTPVALLTLLDKDRQWFKVAKGTDVTDTPRELSFCNYTIKQTEVLVVPDMLEDDRYNNNPMVTDAPNVRFYAGAPLTTTDGYSIGSLCVVDFEAKKLDEHQNKTLKVLSKQVINLMELNWSLHTLAKQNKQTLRHKKVLERSETKLKEAFNHINTQNEALTRIAIVQSHEMRRPVASLIGMLSLIKLEEVDFDYFDMMQSTINELDEKIRIIVKDSEDSINDKLSAAS